LIIPLHHPLYHRQTPLTCGSYSRRSAIKYFLRNGLGVGDSNTNSDANAATLTKAVQALIAQLYAAWVYGTDGNVEDQSFLAYQCQCANGTHSYGCCALSDGCLFNAPCACPPVNGVTSSSSSYACCGCSSSSLLPDALDVPFTTLSGNDTMDGIVSQAAAYVSSTLWTSTDPWLMYDPGARAHFDWTQDPAQAAEALDYALFDTTADAVRSYSADELGTPFLTPIRRMCQGLAGQVHYTIPLNPLTGRPTTLAAAFKNPNSPDAASTTINLTYTEDWVQSLLAQAYAKSPLYWHHSTRHAPSQSAMCDRRGMPPRFYNVSSSNNISTFGWSSLTLGGANNSDCYCGWWFNATHCSPPPGVCAAILDLAYTATAAMCPLHQPAAFDMEAAMRRVLSLKTAWPSEWPCPAMMPSDHWLGVFNNASSSSSRILSRGPSGLRAGSIAWQTQTLLMNPFQRTEPLPPPLGGCSISPPQSLVDHFVDDLFPAAQGVRQGALVSYCIRFVLELARLVAYRDSGDPSLILIASNQQAGVVATWRKRCATKLEQASFCEVHGVFRLTDTAQDDAATAPRCGFFLPPLYPHIVIPSSCLVVYNDVVYDPCLCDPARFCSGAQTPAVSLNPITDLVNYGTKCRVPHPRDMVVDPVSGSPQWPLDSYLLLLLLNANNGSSSTSSSSSSPSPIPRTLVCRACCCACSARTRRQSLRCTAPWRRRSMSS
jgi:hypothetical protein